MTNKFFDLLPIQHQTSVNKNFFESTVEQLFSKANIENIQGFIGTPREIGSSNTSFVEQPAPNREYYSFDPVVTTINPDSGKPVNYVFYEDFLYDIRSKGGLIDNHDRLFKTNQYAFAPPINIDKLINYQDYYWYPTGPEVTEINGNANVQINIDNIQGLKSYTSPAGQELRNDMVVKFTGDHISNTSVLTKDTTYIVTGVGKGIQFILPGDSTSAYAEFSDFPLEQSISITYTQANSSSYYNLETTLPEDFVVTPGGDFKEYYRNLADSEASGAANASVHNNTRLYIGNLALKVGDAVAANVYYLGNNAQRTGNVVYLDVESLGNYLLPDSVQGTRNFALDDYHQTYIQPQLQWNIDTVYGWGSTPWGSESTQNQPDYMVMEKGAKNKNPWSRLNYWWHVNELRQPLKDNVTGFALPESAQRATRPILEFDRDIELYNWGNSFISKVDIIADKKKEDLEGLALGFPINSASGTANASIIFPQDDTAIAEKIYRIQDNSGTIQFVEDTSLSNLVVTNGQVYSITGTNIGLDYYWTGTSWKQAQQKIQINQEPLFNLYDSAGTKVDDPAKYPHSDFKGCPIFTYNTDKTSTKQTSYDADLGANVVYQTSKFNSEPTFFNHLGNHTVNYKANLLANTSTIPGYLFYKDLQQDYKGNDNTRFKNNWHPISYPHQYRDFSNVETYFTNEVVKYEGQYFIANANISAGSFNISNFKYYEDDNSLYSKQYVEDVIIIDKVNSADKFFTTSASPHNNDIIVKLNDTALTINKDFAIRNSSTGIVINPTLNDVSLNNTGLGYEVGDILTLSIAGSNSNIAITVTDAESYDGNISNGGGQIKTISVSNYGLYSELVGHPGNITSIVTTASNNGHGVDATFNFTFNQTVTLKNTDVLNVKTFTKEGRKTTIDSYGFFEIPSALKYNPLNTEITETRLSDLIGHGNKLLLGQEGFSGKVTGNNNFKDTSKTFNVNDINIGQIDSDLLHSMYLSKNEDRNLINALRFGNDQYNNFKKKFISNLELYINNNDYLSQTNLEILDTVLKTIKSSKVTEGGFDLSYMVPIGTDYSNEEIVISNVSLQEYTFSNTVNIALDKNLYILQHNNTVLCADKDYTVDSYLPFDITLNNSITLAENDTLNLRIYEDSESADVPASLSKLGMFRAFQPQFMTDTSYQVNKDVILCHDGSYVIKQNDKIDDIILTFEQIIYSNIEEEYRNCEYIELNEYEIKPSFFCETDYSLVEYNKLLTTNFNKWNRQSKVDYRTNTVFDSTNEFTWNYASGPTEPGYWRGMYDYYYDTQTPTVTPWEMFGYCKKPSWWDTEYPTAITSSYTAFWNNVRDGYIPAGSRKGYWKRWARPTIYSYLPVDSSGNLRSPKEIVYTSLTGDSLNIDNLWAFGDIAPVEYAWRKSSHYPFAILEMLYLSRPGEFAKLFYDKRNLQRLSVQPEQLVDKTTGKRKLRQNFEPHGYKSTDNIITLRPGYTTLLYQYLSFYSLNINVEIGNPVKTLDTRLGHKFAGFVNSKQLNVFSESISTDGLSASQVLPKEDVTVNLHTSPFNSRNFYTGVKITKQAEGYSVSGFDTVSQYFDIIPSDVAGPFEGVQEGGTPADFSVFETLASYLKDEIIKLGSVYYIAKQNISPGAFDSNMWTPLKSLPTIGGASGTVYQLGTGVTEKVYYDTVFPNAEKVFDFLISLSRKQKEIGFDFGEFDSSINSMNDWILAGKRFLFWSTENHEIGDSIKLSPLAETLKFVSTTGKISKINRQINEQYSIVDENNKAIIPEDCSIVREDNTITVSPIGNRIYGMLLHTELVEHAFVINNKTVFNDIINDNVLGIRQDRLEINTQRSRNWDGRYQAEGLVIVGDAVLPNFDTLIDSIRLYHDKDTTQLDPLKSQLAKGLLGYQTTNEYADIKIDDTIGFQYYKGLINQKGTANSLTSLIRSNVVNTNKNIEIFEEWAIKRGEFGDVYNHQSMDIKLEQDKFTRDNQQIEIIYPENVTGAVSNIFVFERNTTYYNVPTIEIDPPASGNAAQATAKLFANAQLESVTITNGGDGYASKPNVAVITGNIVISQFSDVLAFGLAGSNASVDLPLTGANAVTNVNIYDHTTDSNLDIYLGNERSIDSVVELLNNKFTNANIANIVAYGDIDTETEKHLVTQVTKAGSNTRISTDRATITSNTSIEINTPVGSNAFVITNGASTLTLSNVDSITNTNPATVTLTTKTGFTPLQNGDTLTFVNHEPYNVLTSDILNKTYFVKATADATIYELYTNETLTANVDATSWYNESVSGTDTHLQSVGAYRSAEADLVNVEFNYSTITGSGIRNTSYFAELSAFNNSYYAEAGTSNTQIKLYTDPALQIPLNTTALSKPFSDTNLANDFIQANVTVLGTGGDNRLFIKGTDFTIREVRLPGKLSDETTLEVLNIPAGRYQPTQRFPIRSANNTTTNDIIVSVDGKNVGTTYWSYDRGARTSITANASIVNDYNINPNNAFSIVLGGQNRFEDQNITRLNGLYPFAEIYIDGNKVNNTPDYDAFTLTNNLTETTISFSNASLYTDNFSIGSNITVIESGSVQFNNTFTADVPGKVLSIKSVANDTLIANTISKRTYERTKDILTDNKITIDIDDTETMLKRPSNSLQDGLWYRDNKQDYIVPNAGYVNRNKVNWESIDLPYFANLIGSGKVNIPNENDYLHLGKSENEDWNVFQLKKHGIESTTGNISGAKNYIDNVNGRAMLFSDQRLSKWTDGNILGDKTNANFYDNIVVIKNANLSDTVLEWSNENFVFTPRVVYKGDYKPLKKINRGIVKIEPGYTKPITKVEPYKDQNYMARIYAEKSHPAPGLEFFTRASVIKDNLPNAHANSVLISPNSLAGLGVGDIVRFTGTQATAANLTLGKAYTVTGISERGLGGNPGAVDVDDPSKGFFTINEANVTGTDYASINSDCYVTYESDLDFNVNMKVKGLSGASTVLLEVGDTYNLNVSSYISNGLDIDFGLTSGERNTNTNDFYVEDSSYAVANWNSSNKTFEISSNVTTQTAAITRPGFNEITLAAFGNSDGKGNSTLAGANSAIIDKGDFVQFTSVGNYSGNVYPVQSNDGNFIQIYDPAITSNTAGRTAVVYTGSKETRTGSISSLTSNALTLSSFTTSNLGNYGFGNVQYMNSNTSTGVIPGVSGSERPFKINGNTVIVDVADSVRTMQTRFPVHTLRDTTNNTVDLFFRDNGAGEFARVLFNDSEKTPEEQQLLSNDPSKLFNYNNKPVYLGLGLPISRNQLSLETDFTGIPESLRSIDGVELDLEFRYVTEEGLRELLRQTGIKGKLVRTDTSSVEFVNNAYEMLSKTENFDSAWWIENFTYTSDNPSLDGMYIELQARNGNNVTSKLDLIPRHIGEHEAFNITGEVEKGLTISTVASRLLDKNNKHKLKLDFSDLHPMSFTKVISVIDKKQNDLIWTDPNGNIIQVHPSQPMKIRSSLQTNKLKPSHVNGGHYPFEWWSEDVKNVLSQGADNKIILNLGFENGLTTYPGNNNFDIAVPLVIVHGAKFKYTLAPTTKNELLNLRVAIKDDTGNISQVVDRKITSVGQSSITIDNSDNTFTTNDTTNNLNAIIYQVDENKNKQVLANDYGSPVEKSTTDNGYSAVLLQPKNALSSLSNGNTLGYISTLPTQIGSAGTFYVGINNSANVSLDSIFGSNLDIALDYLPLNHTGVTSKQIDVTNVNVAIDVHVIESQHKMFMDTEAVNNSILRFADTVHGANSILTGNILVANTQTNYAIIPKGISNNVGNFAINETQKNSLGIIVSSAYGPHLVLNKPNNLLSVNDTIFVNTSGSANGINNTEFRIREVTENTFTIKLANTNVIPTAELSSMKYLTYGSPIIQGTASTSTVTTRTIHVPANIHVFEPGDNITLNTGAVDTASVNGQTYIVSAVLENAIMINHATAPTSLTTNLTASLTGNANLHIVTLPRGYAIPGVTGSIYDPENNYSLGSNTTVTLNKITDLDFDKNFTTTDSKPVMYFEKDLGTSFNDDEYMIDIYEATRFYSKDHKIGKVDDNQLVVSSTNASSEGLVNIELPNGLRGLSVGANVTFSHSQTGHVLSGNSFVVKDFVNIVDNIEGGSEQYITIEAPGATATANVFSVSYDNYIPSQNRSIKISKTKNYDGFATPFMADKDSFVVNTVYTGNAITNGHWVSDTMLITGTTDFQNEINLKPSHNHIAIKNSPIRNYNATYKMAPIGLDQRRLNKNQIQVFGFTNSNVALEFTDKNVSYSLTDHNVVEVNDNKTYLPMQDTVEQVADSINFVSDFKAGAIDKEKKIEVGFLFGYRDPRSDNRSAPDFNQKYIQRPADVSGLDQVYSYEYIGAPGGNALKGGVNKYSPIKLNETIAERRAPSKLSGKYIIDMQGLEEQVYYGTLNEERTKRPHGAPAYKVLDGKITSDKQLVKDYENNLSNMYLDPTLRTIKNKAEPPFGSPKLNVWPYTGYTGYYSGVPGFNFYDHYDGVRRQLNGHGGGGGISGGGGGPGNTPPQDPPPQDPPVQETCGKFRITLYDTNSGEEGTTYEFDDGLFDIVQQYIDSEYQNISGYQNQFIEAGGTGADWTTVLSYIEGIGENYTKIPYNQIDVDLCELQDLHIKDISGNTCTSSGEVLHLGGSAVNLPEGCDPCSLADSINAQSPNFRAECVPAEDKREPKSCVIKGGRQAWGTTDFRGVDRIVKLGNNKGQSMVYVGQRDDNYKLLEGRKDGVPAVLFGARHDDARLMVSIDGPNLLKTIKLQLEEKGLDPNSYKSIVLRSTTNNDQSGELLHWKNSTSRITNTGSGIKGEYNNIAKHPFAIVYAPASGSVFDEGQQLQTIQYGKDHMGRGINKDTISVYVSKLNRSSYDYGTKGKGILYSLPTNGSSQHKYLGDLFNFTVIDDLYLGGFGSRTDEDTRSNAITTTDEQDDRGFKFTKITGYGERVQSGGKWKDRTGGWFQGLWQYHAKQQRRVQGCTSAEDANIPQLNPIVRIKSAVPFSLGTGCARSPFTEVGDFQPYREKVINSSANLTIANALTPEQYNELGGDNSSVFTPKVISGGLPGQEVTIVDIMGAPDTSNPFMTSDYIRIDGYPVNPRSGEGTRDGQIANANVGVVQTGMVEDSTGFNYMVGDKLTIVGGRPKTIDEDAYYLSDIIVTNPGAGYNSSTTRLEIVDAELGTILPGVQVNPVFQPRDDAVTPVTKNTGRTAISSAILPYKTYVGYKGCRETNWLNDLDTNTAFIDRAGNSINGITLDARRVDIGIDSLNTYYEETVALSATTAMELGTTYKAFIGTRKYENFGEFMMFNFEENSTTGINDRGQSNFTSSFSESERTNLNGAWIMCWNIPNIQNKFNSTNAHDNFSNLTTGTVGIMKSYFDAEAFGPLTRDDFNHFLSDNIKETNGRIVKFLKLANDRVYFQVMNPYDLDTSAGRSIGTPDFTNMFARFYPINALNEFSTDTTSTFADNYEITIENDTSISSNVTASGTATFTMNSKDAVHGLKVKAKRLGENPDATMQQFDIFIFQDGVDVGYLRIPATIHFTIPANTHGGEFDITGTTLATNMSKLNYSTVYRPVVQPVNELEESQAIIYKFDFSNLPDDAKVNDIDIDIRFDSYAPGDFDMMWLTSPEGRRIPILQTLGKFGTAGQHDQLGFLDGHDYHNSGLLQQFDFTLTSNQSAEAIKYGGVNLLHSNKVKPLIGMPTRHAENNGQDYNRANGDISKILGSPYGDSILASQYGINYNSAENVLRKFLRESDGDIRGILGKGTWFLEWSRPGRIIDSNYDPEQAGNKKTKIRTPNIKIKYTSASENPAYDTADKESIGDVTIIQKGGFQPEFATRRYTVVAKGSSGSGFEAQAFLKKGKLVGEDNPELKSQTAVFEVLKINQSGSVTKLRILDRGVYEVFPAEFERGVALKYLDGDMASPGMQTRPAGEGYGARVQCTSRSVINCQQPPGIVDRNAGPSRPATPTEILADAINTAAGLDGGLTLSSYPINPSVHTLSIKTDADGFELSDIVPGTLDALGIPAGDYGPNAFGFSAEVGDGGNGFGLNDSGIRKDNPFDKGDPDSLILYNASTPPEFDGLSSSNFGNVYSYDINRVNGGQLITEKLQSEVDVLYLKSARVRSRYELKSLMPKAWVDNYDVNGWAYLENGKVIYRKDALVDSSKIKSALIYDNITGERISDVYLNDPFKNVHMPEVERNLTYISESDPVYYADDSSNFNSKNVGELWWNTSNMRVRWYEQSDDDYRRQYWGSYVDGSKVDVYEWIESTETPIEYSGEGTPLDIEKYLIDQKYMSSTGIFTNLYYYWVKDITEVPQVKGRTASASSVASLIASPKLENIPTFGAISNNSIVLNNVKSYLTDDESVFQINFKRTETKYKNKHESYILLGEDNIAGKIPDEFFQKLVDSLVEEDRLGKVVPDPYLNKFEKYGISIRPRQTMFVNPKNARRELVYFINSIMKNIKLTDDLYTGWNSTLTTSAFYEFIDWVETGYDTNTIKSRASVKSIKQMRGLTNIPDGAFVRLVGTGTNPDKFYIYDSVKDDYDLVKIVGGTIKLKDSVFGTINPGLASELRKLLFAIRDNIFKNTNLENRLYFSMLNYVLTEQYQTDWCFKTTYFNVRQSAENLIQTPSTKIDTFDSVVKSIKENKPYTSKLRDFEDRKISIDSLKSFATDFDRPPYQPDLSTTAKILDDNNSADVSILTNNTEYVNWSNNYSNNSTKIRTITEKIFIDRIDDEISPIYDHTDKNGIMTVQLASKYKQPQSNTSAIRMEQLANASSNATPINHIERVFKHNTVVTDLTKKIANTSIYSSDIIAGFIATRDATLRTLAYADFFGEELDANVFAKAYYDSIGKEIMSTGLGYDLFGFDSSGFDSKQSVNNYTVNAAVQSQLIRDTLTYQGFDSSTFFTGLTGPSIPPEHALFKPLEGLQINVQSNMTAYDNDGTVVGNQDGIFRPKSGATQLAGTYGNANVSYKIFVGMSGNTEYVRLSDSNKTTLAANITAKSLTIQITDASTITPPYTGSPATAVFIGDERITFEGIEGNTLTGVTRGTNGTSAEPHTVGESVYDATESNNINTSAFAYGANADPEITLWNVDSGGASLPLSNANTSIARFLQASPGSYFG